MAETYDEDEALERFFRAGREAAPLPSAALIDRIVADAVAELPTAATAGSAAAPARRGGLLAGLAAALGGWPSLSGLAVATAAGVWIGYLAPGQVGLLASEIWPDAGAGYDVVDLIPSIDPFLTGDGA